MACPQRARKYERKRGIRSGPFHRRQREPKMFVYVQLDDPPFSQYALQIQVQVIDLEDDCRKYSEEWESDQGSPM